MVRSPISASLTALVLGLLASASRGQCLDWSGTFQTPGADFPIDRAIEWNDGTGPALYVGGQFKKAGGIACNAIARWDGQRWSSLGGGLTTGTFNSAGVTDFLVFDDGTGPALVVTGSFNFADGQPAQGCARWNGTSWIPMGGSGGRLFVFDDGTGPALFTAGSFYVGGQTYPFQKWTGSGWTPLGGNLNGGILSVQVFDDGTGPAVYVGGLFSIVNGQSFRGFARWDGASWSSVGAGCESSPTPWVYDLEIFDDGGGPKLYASGSFTLLGASSPTRVARLDGASWTDIAGADCCTVRVLHVHDDGGGPRLYAGGSFFSLGGVVAIDVASFDGTTWSLVSGGESSGYVNDIATFDDGGPDGPQLIVGGNFFNGWEGGIVGHIQTRYGGDWHSLGQGLAQFAESALFVFDSGSGTHLYAGGINLSVDGMQAEPLARWNGLFWELVPAPIQDNAQARVYANCVYDDGTGPALYIGGSFLSSGGLGSHHILRWDGTTWSGVGGGTGGTVNAMAVYDSGAGPELVVAGFLGSAGGQPLSDIARWNGTSWQPLGLGIYGHINALVVHPEGGVPKLFAGGDFTHAGAVDASRIARWNGAHWTTLGEGVDDETYEVLALASFDDGSGPTLIAGGRYGSIGGFAATNIAQWDGTFWSTWFGGANDKVTALQEFDDGTGGGPALVAGGKFNSIGGVPASKLASFRAGAWSALGSGALGGTSSLIHSMAVWGDGGGGGPHLYVAGSFANAGSLGSGPLAQWLGCGGEILPFCAVDGTMAADCPCQNAGGAGRGCANSQAGSSGALLSGVGATSPDTIVLAASDALPSALCIFLQGSAALASPAKFGDGLRCVGGNLKRLAVRNASGGAVSFPEPGDPTISDQSAALGDPIAARSSRYYQVYYRDPSGTFCPAPAGGTFNVTNGVQVVW